MTAPIIPEGWHAAAEAIAPYAAQPKAGWILIPLAIGGIFRLLMELQLRWTLTEIFQHAPGGSVIVVRKRGLGGSMWIQVGHRGAPAPTAKPSPTPTLHATELGKRHEPGTGSELDKQAAAEKT